MRLGRRAACVAGMGVALILGSACAPTPLQVRANNLWDTDFLADRRPPVDPRPVEPRVRTEPVEFRVGEAALWYHPERPGLSLLIATDVSRRGGLVVFDLAGKTLQRVPGVRLAYGLSVRNGFTLDGAPVDLAVTVEREPGRLRIFRIQQENRRLDEVSGETSVLQEARGTDAGAMGVALYWAAPGDLRAIVSRKSNFDGGGIFFEYRLVDRDGKIDAQFVRDFGTFGGRGIVRSFIVDDTLKALFYYDQTAGIRKYDLSEDPPRDAASFARDGWGAPVSGLALTAGVRRGLGRLIAIDPRDGRTALRVFPREGEVEAPDMHEMELDYFTTSSELASGLEASSRDDLPGFPEGLVVIGNGRTNTYDLYDWRRLRTQMTSLNREQLSDLDARNR